jgi:hypothetical protein
MDLRALAAQETTGVGGQGGALLLGSVARWLSLGLAQEVGGRGVAPRLNSSALPYCLSPVESEARWWSVVVEWEGSRGSGARDQGAQLLMWCTEKGEGR